MLMRIKISIVFILCFGSWDAQTIYYFELIWLVEGPFNARFNQHGLLVFIKCLWPTNDKMLCLLNGLGFAILRLVWKNVGHGLGDSAEIDNIWCWTRNKFMHVPYCIQSPKLWSKKHASKFRIAYMRKRIRIIGSVFLDHKFFFTLSMWKIVEPCNIWFLTKSLSLMCGIVKSPNMGCLDVDVDVDDEFCNVYDNHDSKPNMLCLSFVYLHLLGRWK